MPSIEAKADINRAVNFFLISGIGILVKLREFYLIVILAKFVELIIIN